MNPVRNTLMGLLIAIASYAGISCTNSETVREASRPGYEAIRKKETSLEEIVQALKEIGIRFRVYDNGGNINLLFISDLHFGLGKLYRQFYGDIKEKVPIDKAFLEGVLAGSNHQPDAYLAAARTIGKTDIKAVKKEDALGFYALSSLGLNVLGLEESQLYHDAIRIRLCDDLIPEIIARRAKQSRLPEDITLPSDEQPTMQQMRDWADEIAVHSRNRYWERVMQPNMHPNHNYLLISGGGHYAHSPLLCRDPERRNHPDLLEHVLAKAKVNVIRIPAMEIMNRYLERD